MNFTPQLDYNTGKARTASPHLFIHTEQTLLNGWLRRIRRYSEKESFRLSLGSTVPNTYWSWFGTFCYTLYHVTLLKVWCINSCNIVQYQTVFTKFKPEVRISEKAASSIWTKITNLKKSILCHTSTGPNAGVNYLFIYFYFFNLLH